MDDVARHVEPLVERAREDVLRGEPRREQRLALGVAREGEEKRRDQTVEPRLVDEPLVQAVLPDRQAAVDRRRVRRRRRRELARQTFDERRVADQRVVAVELEELPAEGVEIDE